MSGLPVLGRVLVLDTATAATVVGLRAPSGELIEFRHDPDPGERPGHAAELLELARRACAQTGLVLGALERIGAGVGPGSFTGLRIGIATARSLSQATGASLVAIPTPDALAAGATGVEDVGRTVVAVLDAGRGEAFVGAYRGVERLFGPVAVAAERLSAILEPLGPEPLAVGEGAIRYRDLLEAAGASVPDDASMRHRVSAAGLTDIAERAHPISRDELVPEYVRAPDATPRSGR